MDFNPMCQLFFTINDACHFPIGATPNFLPNHMSFFFFTFKFTKATAPLLKPCTCEAWLLL